MLLTEPRIQIVFKKKTSTRFDFPIFKIPDLVDITITRQQGVCIKRVQNATTRTYIYVFDNTFKLSEMANLWIEFMSRIYLYREGTRATYYEIKNTTNHTLVKDFINKDFLFL